MPVPFIVLSTSKPIQGLFPKHIHSSDSFSVKKQSRCCGHNVISDRAPSQTIPKTDALHEMHQTVDVELQNTREPGAESRLSKASGAPIVRLASSRLD